MRKILFTLTILFGIHVAQAGEIEFTVHHGPGGPSDKITRLIHQELPKNYIVVNRPGASGKIAMRQIMSKPSMMIATMPQIFATNPIMFSDLEYNPDTDLELLAVIGAMPNVLACNNKHEFKTFNDFKKTTKSLNFGVAGYGSSEHIATVTLLTQFKNTHAIIPYAQGGSASLTDLLSGNIDCMFANYPLIKEHIKDTQRITALMSSHNLGLTVPTWEQTFKFNYPVQSQLGLIIKKDLDPEIKHQILQDVSNVLSKSGLREEVKNLGLFPILKMDVNSIKESLAINKTLKEVIIKNNIKLTQ